MTLSKAIHGDELTAWVRDGVWPAHQAAGDYPAFHECRAYQVTGRLDAESLRAAWRAVARRHGVADFTIVDVSGDSTPAACAESAWARAMSRPFDLEGGPLARLTVIRLGPRDHQVLLAAHRIAADGRSLSMLVKRISQAYAAKAADEPEPAVPRFEGDAERGVEGDFEWWRRRLEPVPAQLALPLDRRRPEGLSWRGGMVWFDFDAAQLSRVAFYGGVTRDLVVLAAFQVLLRRYTAMEMVSVGLMAETPVVLATDFTGAPTFREILARVEADHRAAVGRPRPPLVRLARELHPGRDPLRVPWCDAMFLAPDPGHATLRLPGAIVRELPASSGSARTDLTLGMVRMNGSLRGCLEYRKSIFEHGSMLLMAQQLRHLLAVLDRDGLDVPVDALPLEPMERLTTPVQADHAPLKTVIGLIAHHARRDPDAPAVHWQGQALSYRDLYRRSGALAARLRSLGEGAPIAVRVPAGPDQVVALLAVLRAGGHFMWIGAGNSGERARRMMAALAPRCLLIGGDPAASQEDELAVWYRDEMGGRLFDVTAGDPAVSEDDSEPDLEHTAYVAFTADSTGRPRGVPQSHAALAQFATWFASAFDLGPGARVAQWVAPEYDPALCEVFAALVSGAALCPVPEHLRAHPERFVGWLTAERITLLQTIPSFARRMLRALTERGDPAALSKLDRLLLIGEALSSELVNALQVALPGRRLANVYGPTETIAATWHEVTGRVEGATPIGRPIPGREVLIVDDMDRPCPTGITGNLVIRGRYVTPGYLHDGDADAALRPLRHGSRTGRSRTYRTGDLARRRWDGLLEFQGRRDLQIKLNGHRLELTEIEAALTAHPAVAECAAVALSDGDGIANRLIIYVVPDERAAAAGQGGVEAWRAWLRSAFGKVVLPASFHTMDGPLPRNAAGKVDRHRLPTPSART